jgi:predicted Zn-dependent protease
LHQNQPTKNPNQVLSPMSRLEKLQTMLAEDPNDTFLRYAVAMELRSNDQFTESEAGFRGLMESEPPYVPAFFMLGQMLAGEDRVNEAREVIRNGIEQARLQNDHHAAGEMSEFLASLGQLGE